MGVSDLFHFAWLDEAISPIRKLIRQSLPKRPQVLGVGEQAPNLFLEHLLHGMDYTYLACDLFPKTERVLFCDINDLSPLFGKIRADVVSNFRSSYFIENKSTFFKQ